jgi:hypothetical protein
MHVGMPIEEAPSALHVSHSPGNSRARPRHILEEVLECIVGQSGEAGQPFPAPEERPQPPSKGDDRMTVGEGFQDLLGDELADLRLPLRVTGGTNEAAQIRWISGRGGPPKHVSASAYRPAPPALDGIRFRASMILTVSDTNNS